MTFALVLPSWSDQPWFLAWRIDSLHIPFATSCIFIVIQFVHLAVARVKGWREISIPHTEEDEHEYSFTTWVYFRITQHGGPTRFFFLVSRLVGCLLLLGLSVISLLSCSGEAHDEELFKSHSWFLQCPEFYMTLTYFYASVLAFGGLSSCSKRHGDLARTYQAVILFVVFCVYGYRDIWPFATFNRVPQDATEGFLLWIRIAILTVTAIVLPVSEPRRYTPVDPKNPMPIPNDEQTCSILSLLTYSYLDPIIFLGYRVPHVSYHQLPPLCDTDSARYVREQGFPYLDLYNGGKKEHLFFGLMRVFLSDYIKVATLTAAHTGFVFLSPVAINKLLNFMENGGKDATIRPWFWVFCIFLSPTIRAIVFQLYIFVQTRTLVRTESLLTELIFEHSFRIRLKADAGSNVPSAKEDKKSTSLGRPESDSDSSVEGSSTETRSSSQPSESTVIASRPPSTTPSVVLKQTTVIAAASRRPDYSANILGRINNLLTTDLANIVNGRDFPMIVIGVPLQVLGSIIFLYILLGWSAFVGLGLIIAFMPVPGYLAKVIQKYSRERMKTSDARVQQVTEAVNVIRMVKLFGWESRIYDRIQEKREDELRMLLKVKLLQISTQVLNLVVPALTMLASYATYSIVMKEGIMPSKIFSTIAVFTMLRSQLSRISFLVGQCIQAKVSLDRLSDFLRNSEVLDQYSDPEESDFRGIGLLEEQEGLTGFRDTTFSWSLEDDGDSTPSSRPFRLRIDGEVLLKDDAINLVVGPTGGGKTSLLMALLGEMHHIPRGPSSWFNLPRDGGVAYAAQESWVQSATIRENIIFGTPYDEDRYRKVLYQCALEKDLELLSAGDHTEVGEKGITLSGGQKARITLARAIYSHAKIILLDDVLAALDVHTSLWIVEQCFKGDLLHSRMVVLVTHNVTLVQSIAQRTIVVKIDGTVSVEDTINPQENQATEAAIHEATEVVQKTTSSPVDEPPKPDLGGKPSQDRENGKLIVEEEIPEGRITWQSIKLFLFGMSDNKPVLFFTTLIIGFMSIDWSNVFQTWFLGLWGSQYEHHPPEDVSAARYLGIYSIALTLSVLVYIATYGYYAFASMRASRSINSALTLSILRSTVRWLDKTPTARIITRCTQDINAVDTVIPIWFSGLTDITVILINRLASIVLFSPVFLVPGLVVTGLGLYLGNMYLRSQLSVKRELSNARSPLLAHLGAAIAGMVSIRAYGAQEAFKTESMKRIDHYVRIGRMTYNLNRWISVRTEFIGAVFSGALAAYLVYWSPIGAANTGFSLTMSVDFCMMNMFWIRTFNLLEVEANSLERIHGYLEIEHEADATNSGKPPASWPTSGSLKVENLSARYTENGPKVLEDISFDAKPGERLGLVGRTGSGKSSLALALLRCILTDGAVYYDGLPTATVNLEDLRSRVTIIPQIPELLSGTLRRNLDPFEEHDDATLNYALKSAGLQSLQDELGEARLTLDSNVASSGGNLSVGQRQIIALARAVIRNSKLLILDEATSAIDYKTDAIIQHTLRHELGSDTTVITIAHRLQTIMDADKIIVLEAGKIVEFDTPSALLKKEAGYFKSLIDESGDKEHLLKMLKQ